MSKSIKLDMTVFKKPSHIEKTFYLFCIILFCVDKEYTFVFVLKFYNTSLNFEKENIVNEMHVKKDIYTVASNQYIIPF